MHELDPDLRALQEVRDYVERAKRACDAVSHYTQPKIDALVQAMAVAGEAAAYDLARLAVEETGIGRVHYKVLKNLFGSRGIYESIKNEKTVGVVARDDKLGVLEVATPVGVVAGIIPTTNPTSTALAKALISVKGRNAIVISPHPRAKRCIGETVEVLRRAIERAGGPPDLVLSLASPTIESTGALMKHKKVSIVLATGGAGLVHAAYSSGKPAYGVGPGNVPAYVDRSADLSLAARSLVSSKAFDNGTLCCSEQALVLDRPIAERLLAEMKRRGAWVTSAEETEKLGRLCNRGGHMNPDVVGLDPWRIAEMAGFQVPRETTVLLASQDGVGPKYPLSIEILAPVLSVHLAEDWRDGCRISMEVLEYGGLGHTCSVYARDERVLDAWFLEKPANRILANGPTSQGAVGYSTWLVPSMSLGCGPQAGNITSDNISVRHLLNIKRVAWPRKDWEQIERNDHEWAAQFTHDRSPRGSGMPGDPALLAASPRESTSAFSTPLVSNWQGNPAMYAPRADNAPPASRAPASFTSPGSGSPRAASSPDAAAAPRASSSMQPKVRPAPKSPGGSVAVAVLERPSPAVATAFGATGASSSALPARSAAPSGVNPARSGAAPANATYVGAGLSVDEIQHIMSHAGSGCPLGPCRGCPHNNVDTGACMA